MKILRRFRKSAESSHKSLTGRTLPRNNGFARKLIPGLNKTQELHPQQTQRNPYSSFCPRFQDYFFNHSHGDIIPNHNLPNFDR